jgi:hypothetical protein
MAVGIYLFTKDTQNLECGHHSLWIGALNGSLGTHLIALDCAICVQRQDAWDTLRDFALYVQLSASVTQENQSRQSAMTAGSS